MSITIRKAMSMFGNITGGGKKRERNFSYYLDLHEKYKNDEAPTPHPPRQQEPKALAA